METNPRETERSGSNVIGDALRGVPRRPPRPLYEPSWTARHFGGVSDLVAKLDPAPLGRAARRVTEPAADALGRGLEPLASGLSRLTDRRTPLGRAIEWVRDRIGMLVVPAERTLSRAGASLRSRSNRLAGVADEALTRAPLPRSLRRALWIPPFDLVEPGDPPAQTRMKTTYGAVLWVGVIVSVAAHTLAFELAPTFDVEDVSFNTAELAAVEIPPEVEIPPPPSAVVRPATPVISDIPMDDDITIAATTFADNPVAGLAPPPTERTGEGDEEGLGTRPTFTPFTVAPEIRNRSELARLIGAHYPSTLRDAGIGGIVVVWFFIDAEGDVTDTRVAESSGHQQLDDAALEVSDLFVFSPALNNDQVVPVWVQFPITFAVR